MANHGIAEIMDCPCIKSGNIVENFLLFFQIFYNSGHSGADNAAIGIAVIARIFAVHKFKSCIYFHADFRILFYNIPLFPSMAPWE